MLRLDWQMWFAALGNYNSNPWFINFVRKLLDNCHPVMQLVGDPKMMMEKGRLVKIRAKLFSYDFTRIESEWNILIPGAEVIFRKDRIGSLLSGASSTPLRYWKRKFLRLYMPPYEQGDESLDAYLMRLNYIGDYQGRCFDIGQGDRCKYATSLWCLIATFVRRLRVHIVMISCLAVYLARSLKRLFTMTTGEAELQEKIIATVGGDEKKKNE